MQLKKAITLALASSGLVAAQQATAADAVDAVAHLTTTNFVTIIIDDMGFSDMQPFGGEIPTPNIQALADDGVVLNNFYAASSSSPSRGMLYTGYDSHTSGLGTLGGTLRQEQIGKPGYEIKMNLDWPGFPRLLQDNGYYTMMVGKWHMGEEPEYWPTARGFSETKALLLPGGDVHFLSDDSGDILSSQWTQKRDADGNLVRDADGNLEWEIKEHLYIAGKGTEAKVDSFPTANAYETDLFTDQGIEMLKGLRAENPTQNFYLNMSYLVTHTPVQAPRELIDKYYPIYMQGWDLMRENRFERLREKGMIPKDSPMPARSPDVPAWDTMSEPSKQLNATRMAAYAGMVEMLDINVGKLVEYLKSTGDYDNTVFFMYSDNGAEDVAPAYTLITPRTGQILKTFPQSIPAFFGADYEEGDEYNIDPNSPNFDQAKFDELLAGLGGPQSYMDPGLGWAEVMSAPFSEIKAMTYEGGIHTAAFVTAPQSGLKGLTYNCLTSVMDISATFLEIAGVEYPKTWNGKEIPPLEGVSMKGMLKDGQLFCDPERYLAFEMDGVKGVRKGNWKLSQRSADDNWYLYNVAVDPSETNDLADNPEYDMKYREMLGLYNEYAKAHNVVPVSNKRLPLLSGIPSKFNPRLSGVNDVGGSGINVADNSPSEAVFTGGNAYNGAIVTYPSKVTGDTEGLHDIAAQVRPAPGDVGKPGRVYAYGSYAQDVGEAEPEMLYFAFTKDGLIPTPPLNAGEFPPPFRDFSPESDGLPERVFIPIWKGALPLPGKIELNFAYENAEGNVVVAGAPIEVTLTLPKPKEPTTKPIFVSEANVE